MMRQPLAASVNDRGSKPGFVAVARGKDGCVGLVFHIAAFAHSFGHAVPGLQAKIVGVGMGFAPNGQHFKFGESKAQPLAALLMHKLHTAAL